MEDLKCKSEPVAIYPTDVNIEVRPTSSGQASTSQLSRTQDVSNVEEPRSPEIAISHSMERKLKRRHSEKVDSCYTLNSENEGVNPKAKTVVLSSCTDALNGESSQERVAHKEGVRGNIPTASHPNLSQLSQTKTVWYISERTESRVTRCGVRCFVVNCPDSVIRGSGKVFKNMYRGNIHTEQHYVNFYCVCGSMFKSRDVCATHKRGLNAEGECATNRYIYAVDFDSILVFMRRMRFKKLAFTLSPNELLVIPDIGMEEVYEEAKNTYSFPQLHASNESKFAQSSNRKLAIVRGGSVDGVLLPSPVRVLEHMEVEPTECEFDSETNFSDVGSTVSTQVVTDTSQARSLVTTDCTGGKAELLTTANNDTQQDFLISTHEPVDYNSRTLNNLGSERNGLPTLSHVPPILTNNRSKKARTDNDAYVARLESECFLKDKLIDSLMDQVKQLTALLRLKEENVTKLTNLLSEVKHN